MVFSTSVEVFPWTRCGSVWCRRLLHVRGGVSSPRPYMQMTIVSSPRPWRCFRASEFLAEVKEVFSTSVEVFPCTGCGQSLAISLLHVRGGVSPVMSEGFLKQMVFSTSVEVFPQPYHRRPSLQRLLHVRGGVSKTIKVLLKTLKVFSTSVEVFPIRRST